jgi:hypothetical protein
MSQYVIQRPHTAHLHFRSAVPAHLRAALNKREIVISLHTARSSNSYQSRRPNSAPVVRRRHASNPLRSRRVGASMRFSQGSYAARPAYSDEAGKSTVNNAET